VEIQNNLCNFAAKIFKQRSMNKVKIACIGITMLASSTAVNAGGFLTNTNQNVAFNRNMARDGAIGIDGVYSNPAGVAFLTDGLHLSFNIQSVYQTRNVETGYYLSNYGLFQNNVNTPATAENKYQRKFKGKANAPIIPSFQAAYNKNNWSFQFGFAVVGGGGKCEYDNGLGSFEGIVSLIPAKLIGAGINDVLSASGSQLTGGYSFDSYMRGRQFFYGFTLGAAKKVTDNLSVYGGVRLLYASANYFGYVKNISFQMASNSQTSMVSAPTFFENVAATSLETAGKLEQAASMYSTAGDAQTAAAYQQKAATLEATAKQMAGYSVSTQDIELNCDQQGWGIAPIIGVDYKIGKLNLASKFEFKTRLRLQNESANSASAESISALSTFADGKSVADDMPALLTVGAQYEILPSLRVMAGYHHFFDIDTKQFTSEDMGDTNEYLFGAEYDINKKLQVSAGIQRTDYSQTDDHLNDISFSLDSYTWGFGFGYQVSDAVKINAAYFQTDYSDWNKMEVQESMTISNTFSRTNRVFAIGVDLTL